MIVCSPEELSKIITEGFDTSNITGASYELTTGPEYFDLTENHAKKLIASNTLNKKILIKPLHKVVLMTAEELTLPENIVGRVVTKGSLFSIGLSAVNTIADPGFTGRLGLVFYNFSPKYIVLDVGQKIAKIDFNKVDGNANNYKGQHGFSLKHWPVLTDLQFSYDEVKNHDQMKASPLDEAYEVLPNSISELLKKLKSGIRALRWIFILLCIVNFLTLILLSFDKVEGIWAGLLVNGISSFLGFLYTFLYKKIL